MLKKTPKIVLAFILFALFSNCGASKMAKPISVDTLNSFKSKYATYLYLSKRHQDVHGFINSSECDSLLFTGLYGINPVDVDITAARDVNGRWYRRPTDNPCYPEHSKSTISRDMMLGLFWYMWKNQRLDLADKLFKDAAKDSFIIGVGDAARIYMTPGLQSTLAELCYQLGGDNRVVYRAIPQFTGKTSGFAAHLDVLHLLLRADMRGSIDFLSKDTLRYHHKREPNNPLFSFAYHKYTDGDFSSTIELLMNPQYFPERRLPTTADRKGGWLQERDEGKDWAPVEGELEEHSGGDFLFVAKLILDEM